MIDKCTAYLIEPDAGTICYVGIDRLNRTRSIRPLIGCQMIDAINIGKRHLVYCDDNGFGGGVRFVCELVGYPRPFAGNLLVTGLGDKGEITSPYQTISAIADLFAIVRPVFDPLFDKLDEPELSAMARLNIRIERKAPIILTS